MKNNYLSSMCFTAVLTVAAHWGALAQEDWPHQSTDWQDPHFQARVMGYYDWVGTGPDRLVVITDLGEMIAWAAGAVNRDLQFFPPRIRLPLYQNTDPTPKDWVDREYLIQYLRSNESIEEEFFEDRLDENATADTYYLMGNIYFLQHEYAKAIENYLIAIEKFPRFKLAHKNLAYTYIILNDCGSALPAALLATEYGALTPRLKRVEGYCSLQAGDFNKAVQALSMAQLLDPDNKRWMPTQILALAGLGRTKQAELLLQDYIEAVGATAEAVDLALELYRRADDQDGIFGVLEMKKRMGLISDSQEHDLQRLKVSAGVGGLLEDEELRNVIAKVPSKEQYTEILEGLNSAFSERDNDTVEFAVNRDYTDLPGALNARLQVAQARTLLNSGRSQEALAKVEMALQEYPTDCDALLLAVQILNANGEAAQVDPLMVRAQNSSEECEQAFLPTRIEIMLSRREYVQAYSLIEQDFQQKYIFGQLENSRMKELKEKLNDLVVRIAQ